MSKVRKYVTDVKVAYTGTFIIQGEIIEPELRCPEFFGLCNGNISMTASGEINLVVNPNNDGAMSYGATFRKPEQWLHENGLKFDDNESISTFLITMLDDWDDNISNYSCLQLHLLVYLRDCFPWIAHGR